MPNIVGPFQATKSNVMPLEAHIGHLRHLTNPAVARRLLCDHFECSTSDAKNSVTLFCAQIEQSINFHEESKRASLRIRPVLQYYSYLNLAVAAILAYRPLNYNQYRQHGATDKTHALKSLELNSVVLKVKSGAVPLFHSILSDVDLKNRSFKLLELVSGINMLSHEISSVFGKKRERLVVKDSIFKVGGEFKSKISFECYVNEIKQNISEKKLQLAMPLLVSDYTREDKLKNPIVYISNQSWKKKDTAYRNHRKYAIKLINYGGHGVAANGSSSSYYWHGLSRTPLLPSLTSVLLMSFALASIVRYRPALLDSALSSQYQFIIGTFVQESDGVFFPAVRNLLYRQEVAIGNVEFM